MNARLFSSLFFFCFFSISSLLGQNYKTAIGLRIDNGLALTVQQHIVNNWTVEGILHPSIRNDDLGVTLLVESHQKLLFRGVNLYAGAGPHFLFKSQRESESDSSNSPSHTFGLSAIGGVELSLGRLNFAVDLKPRLNLTNTDDVNVFDWTGASLSVRYILAKRERRTIKDWDIWDKFGGNKKKRRS